jgi:hypothetical protein
MNNRPTALRRPQAGFAAAGLDQVECVIAHTGEEGSTHGQIHDEGGANEEAQEVKAQKAPPQRQPVQRLACLCRQQRADPVVSIMARFSVRKLRFGHGPVEDDDGTGLPLPLRVKLAARRAAGIREAKETLALLPGPGESLHALCTARMDLTDVIGALLERLGRCDRLVIGTLGYNARNLRTMLRWLDAGQVAGLTLLASIFFRSHNGDLWQETLAQFRQRKQRAACCHSHAKVVSLSFASGARLAIEGSANLCGNGSGREQFALINDAGLAEWHARWVLEAVSRHEGKEQGQ